MYNLNIQNIMNMYNHTYYFGIKYVQSDIQSGGTPNPTFFWDNTKENISNTLRLPIYRQSQGYRIALVNGLYYCIITLFNYPMDFRNSTASYTRFGGIFVQIDVAHSAACGGAQAFGVLGEAMKMHDFFDCPAQFFCKSSGVCQKLNFVAQTQILTWEH